MNRTPAAGGATAGPFPAPAVKPSPKPALKQPERGNVHSVTRALQLLDAFLPDEQGVSLADLSRRLDMGKTTVLRTARTLERSGYLARLEDGRWRLGAASGWLGVRYQTSFDAKNVIESVLRRMTKLTGETTALFVRENASRTCVARVERPSLARKYIRVGERLPLEKGASGHVLLAFSGQDGEIFDEIRRRGFHISVGERDTRFSSIATPVHTARHRLFGALCVSGEAERLGYEQLSSHLRALISASEALSRALAANTPPEPSHAKDEWRDRGPI